MQNPLTMYKTESWVRLRKILNSTTTQWYLVRSMEVFWTWIAIFTVWRIVYLARDILYVMTFKCHSWMRLRFDMKVSVCAPFLASRPPPPLSQG